MHHRSECNTYDWSSLLKDSDYDIEINHESISTRLDDNVLIWLDASINMNKQDDQHSISQLRRVVNSVYIFTDKEKCLKFINKFINKSKLFFIVSGSLGKEIISQICNLSQIVSIYVFCAQKINHECWAQKYEKIKGVFDDITDVCELLKHDKQKLEQDRLFERVLGLLPQKRLSPSLFNEVIDFNHSHVKYDNHQPNDATKRIVTSADIPFSKEESCSPIQEVETDDNIQSGICSSETVTPFVQHKQQMGCSDTGILPCISVIGNTRDRFFNHIQSIIGTVNYSDSAKNCLKYVDDHRDDRHLIVICNLTNVELVPTFIQRSNVRKVYIYCPDDQINEYRVLNERFINTVSMLQHIDTLTRLILWDLSACIMEIGNYYDSINKKNLAQARYRYAYHIHTIIKANLTDRMKVIGYNQSKEFRN